MGSFVLESQVSIERALQKASDFLYNTQGESPKVDASVLLCEALSKPSSYLFTWPEKPLSDVVRKQFCRWINRRAQGEPVAYLVGYREFWSLELEVSPTTLIPRPDTERLVELALSKVSQQQSVLDLGTGTGAIALAIASERPSCDVLGVDLQQEAVALAMRNKEKLGIKNLELKQSDWFSSINSGQKFDCICSNPPYIDKCDPHLKQGDVRFEPSTALVANEEGYADLIFIATQARNYLANKGWLLMEHGFEQGERVRICLQKLGYQCVATEQDYAGNERVTLGQWIGEN